MLIYTWRHIHEEKYTRWINACNLDVLHLWGGNTDLQYVLNEISAVMYICSYMTKSEKAMGETLKRFAKECYNDDIHT